MAQAAPAKRGVLSPRLRRRLVPYVFLVPATAAMLLIYFYPMLRGVFTSFLDYNTAIGTSEFSGLENYRDIMRDGSFWNSMRRSAIWVVGSVVGQFVVGFAFALLLNERWPGNRLVRALMLVPWVMPGVSVALGWRLIYDEQFGLLNDLLGRMGLPQLTWLNDPNLAMLGVILANIWKAFPFVTVTMLAGLAAIPDDLYDAAKVDGATMLNRFRYVTLPGVRNVTFVVVLLMVVWTFNYFDLVFVMTEGGPAQATEIAPVLVARYAFQQFDYGLAATVAVIMTVFNIIFAVLYIKTLRRAEA
jgi:multiple sugar transport system permease protein